VARGTRLFEHIVIFENYPVDAAVKNWSRSSLKFSEVSIVELNHYPLALIIRSGAELVLLCHYNRRRFDREGVERLLGHVFVALESIIDNPGERVADISLLTEAERNQLLVEWNRTKAEYPPQCVHEFFEQQAARTPMAVAVEHEDDQVNYGELNARANRLARYLRRLGAGPEVTVGICMDRRLEMMVALLAC